jgi:prepilin-type N-terminal cleavage/methylation domain-containing protein
MHCNSITKAKQGGMTLMEIVITLVIIGILGAVSTVSLQHLLVKEKLDQVTNEFMEHLVAARSATVTELVKRRLKLESSTSYCIQVHDQGTDTYLNCNTSDVRNFPPGIAFRYDDYPTLASVLVFEPSGIPNFGGAPPGNYTNNPATSDPFITIKNQVAGTSKGISISVAGAIKIGPGETDVIP